MPTICVLTPTPEWLLNGGNSHGAQHDKMLKFQRQPACYFVRLVQRGRPPVSVPMPALRALNLTSLLLQNIKRNYPHLTRDYMSMTQDQLVGLYVPQVTPQASGRP